MNRYEDFNKSDLVRRILELEKLLEEHREEKAERERLDYLWTGNLGNWDLDCKTNTITFNPLQVTNLGYGLEEVPQSTDYQFFIDRLHPDDYEMVMAALKEHLAGQKAVYEAEYRIKTKQGEWKWYHDTGKIKQRDTQGQPILVSGNVFDITQRKQLEIKLEEQDKILSLMATTDDLTKLLTRRMIYNRLDEEIRRAERYQMPLSILLLDIDHFKRVNDTFGHLRGDEVLMDVAGILKKEVRSTDLIGRFGGEEFLIILPNTTQAETMVMAERIRKTIRNTELVEGLKLTISGGLKTYEGESETEILITVDNLCYQAKERGRDQIAQI